MWVIVTRSTGLLLIASFDSTGTLAKGKTLFPNERLIAALTHPATYKGDLPSAFRALAREKKLSSNLLAALSRALDISKSATMRQDVRAKVTRKYNDFLEACPILGEREGLEKMICLALMVYCALCTNRILTSVFNSPRMVLFNMLRGREEQSWAERECILWIQLMRGGFTAPAQSC